MRAFAESRVPDGGGPLRQRLPKRDSFVAYWQAHAWVGVTTSLVLYWMFSLGSVTLFYRHLALWEEPLLHRAAQVPSSLEAMLRLVPDLPEDFYFYLPSAEQPLTKVGYYVPGTEQWRMVWLDADQMLALPQREAAAGLFYDLHYFWHEATGAWLQYSAGALVLGFLFVQLTGLLLQWGRLRRQLHRLRTAAGPRVAWSDLHKVLGVIGFPFQVGYALSGALMVLAPLVVTLAIDPVFGGDELRAANVAGALVDDPPPIDRGPRAPALPLDGLVASARQALPKLHPDSVVVRGHGRRDGEALVRGHMGGGVTEPASVSLHLTTGNVQHVETEAGRSATATLAHWLHLLHTAEDASAVERTLLALLGAAGALTILSGNWIWLERRRRQGIPGNRSGPDRALLVATTAVGVGVPLGASLLLLLSRLLPLSWPNRPSLEQGGFALGLLLATILAMSVRSQHAWCLGLGLAGLLLAWTPLAQSQLSGAGLWGSGPMHPTVAWVDGGLTLAGVGLVMSVLAWIWNSRKPRATETTPRASGVTEPLS